MKYNISNRISALKTSTTMDIAAKAIEMKSNGIDLIDLSVGEPDFPTPEHIKLAAKKALDNDKTKYTLNAGTIELRQAIAKKLLSDNNLRYSTDEIIVSAGAKQSLFNAVQVLVNEGDEVIVPVPTYVSYIQMVKFAGGIPITVQTNESDYFKLKPEELLAHITSKTKLLILCNPSNPTGAVYTSDELEKLVDIIVDKNLFVLSDEIYEKLIYDDTDFKSIASIGAEIKNRTVVVNGFSKSYSMTGWRIGYAAAGAEIIKNMAKLQSHSTSNASSISQAAALEALSANQDIVEFMRSKFEARRNFIHGAINKIPGIYAVEPKGAFYLFVNVGLLLNKELKGYFFNTSDEIVMYLLEEAKVSTVPGTAFGTDGFIRISYATSMENLMRAIEKLNEAFGKIIPN